MGIRACVRALHRSRVGVDGSEGMVEPRAGQLHAVRVGDGAHNHRLWCERQSVCVCVCVNVWWWGRHGCACTQQCPPGSFVSAPCRLQMQARFARLAHRSAPCRARSPLHRVGRVRTFSAPLVRVLVRRGNTSALRVPLPATESAQVASVCVRTGCRDCFRVLHIRSLRNPCVPASRRVCRPVCGWMQGDNFVRAMMRVHARVSDHRPTVRVCCICRIWPCCVTRHK